MIDFIWKAIGVAVLAIIGSISVMVFKGREDNPVEEVSEQLIYMISGEDVDLTPTSPEK
jgi:hypothetical protein